MVVVFFCVVRASQNDVVCNTHARYFCMASSKKCTKLIRICLVAQNNCIVSIFASNASKLFNVQVSGNQNRVHFLFYILLPENSTWT